jgi:hypothetical protein
MAAVLGALGAEVRPRTRTYVRAPSPSPRTLVVTALRSTCVSHGVRRAMALGWLGSFVPAREGRRSIAWNLDAVDGTIRRPEFQFFGATVEGGAV